jgi:hypothetical protein
MPRRLRVRLWPVAPCSLAHLQDAVKEGREAVAGRAVHHEQVLPGPARARARWRGASSGLATCARACPPPRFAPTPNARLSRGGSADPHRSPRATAAARVQPRHAHTHTHTRSHTHTLTHAPSRPPARPSAPRQARGGKAPRDGARHSPQVRPGDPHPVGAQALDCAQGGRGAGSAGLRVRLE